MKKYTAFTLMFLTACPSYADMFTALKDVYETNPTLLIKRQSVKAAEAGIGLAKTNWQPSIGASAGIARTRTKAAGDVFHENQKQIGINATQNIFHGFTTTARIKAAEETLKSETAALHATEQETFLSAVNAYIGVLNAREVLKLNKNNEIVLKEYRNQYIQKEQVGVLTKTDVAQATARLEWAKYQVIEAQAQYDNALETFRKIYGKTLPAYDEIDLKRLSGLFPKTLHDAEEKALTAHPDILAAKAFQNASEENVSVSRETYMPSVDIKASALKYQDVPLVDDISDSRIGVYLNVPLYDRGTAFAQTHKAKAEASAAREQIVQIRRLVLEKLRQAWHIHEAQKAAVKSAKIRIEASTLALDGVRDEQERGSRTVLDVLNAEQELLDAKVALTQAKHSRISAYFAVLSGTGALSASNLGLR